MKQVSVGEVQKFLLALTIIVWDAILVIFLGKGMIDSSSIVIIFLLASEALLIALVWDPQVHTKASLLLVLCFAATIGYFSFAAVHVGVPRESNLELKVASDIVASGRIDKIYLLPRLQGVAAWPIIHVLAAEFSIQTSLGIEAVGLFLPILIFVTYVGAICLVAQDILPGRMALMVVLVVVPLGLVTRAILSRESIAVLFLMLGLHAFLRIQRKPDWRSVALFALFGTALVLSHVFTSIFFVMILLVAWIAAQIMKHRARRAGGLKNAAPRRTLGLTLVYSTSVLAFLIFATITITGSLAQLLGNTLSILFFQEAEAFSYAYQRTPIEASFRFQVFIWGSAAVGVCFLLIAVWALVKLYREGSNDLTSNATLSFTMTSCISATIMTASIVIPRISRVVSYSRVYAFAWLFLALAAATSIAALRSRRRLIPPIFAACALTLLLSNIAFIPPTLYSSKAVPNYAIGESSATFLFSEYNAVDWITSHQPQARVVSDNKAIDLFNSHDKQISANVYLTGGRDPVASRVFLGNLSAFQSYDLLYLRFETFENLNGDGQTVPSSRADPYLVADLLASPSVGILYSSTSSVVIQNFH